MLARGAYWRVDVDGETFFDIGANVLSVFRLVRIDAYSRKSDKSLRHNVDKQIVLSSSNIEHI